MRITVNGNVITPQGVFIDQEANSNTLSRNDKLKSDLIDRTNKLASVALERTLKALKNNGLSYCDKHTSLSIIRDRMMVACVTVKACLPEHTRELYG